MSQNKFYFDQVSREEDHCPFFTECNVVRCFDSKLYFSSRIDPMLSTCVFLDNVTEGRTERHHWRRSKTRKPNQLLCDEELRLLFPIPDASHHYKAYSGYHPLHDHNYPQYNCEITTEFDGRASI